MMTRDPSVAVDSAAVEEDSIAAEANRPEAMRKIVRHGAMQKRTRETAAGALEKTVLRSTVRLFARPKMFVQLTTISGTIYTQLATDTQNLRTPSPSNNTESKSVRR